MQQKSICFIGGGNMAQAIILGLLKTGYPPHLITVCDPNADKLFYFAKQGVQTQPNNAVAAQQADVVLLAVKPQLMAEVCQHLTQSAVDFSHKLVISIAAGISLARLSALLPSATQVVRIMPNTPALVSEGMAGLYASPSLDIELKTFAENLLSAVGKTCWVEKEEHMHTVTAASGSSPAYFFLLMEAMQNAITDLGFDQETARLLIQQSALGAAKMVIENPEISLTTLRENVTSKGGTTAAALDIFAQHDLSTTVQQAIHACIQRSQEMETLF
ncbi:pyrroline-5-carboxylate reductase [Conservatibacter flavescens]|uniref:Pyrroline-5-carboxylate reductase n=1 Tax=Conservatibacter flavescens TaxID=28161 RepID=A0A2M8S294_9PAST|nr:pyrroline-5-carboxylate reductase [Conservatibacter flavescens]PJG85244.1 pyrroline-5-carboxylate reductase [Conservatibacter flavescens]